MMAARYDVAWVVVAEAAGGPADSRCSDVGRQSFILGAVVALCSCGCGG